MKVLECRVDDALHKQVKLKALEENKTIREYILELVNKDLAKNK